MDKYYDHHKYIYNGQSELYFFTWSIPNFSSIDCLEQSTKKFTMKNESKSYGYLNISKGKITFKIMSTKENLKCFASMFIGPETLLLSNCLVKSTGSTGPRPYYFYYLMVTLSSEDTSFQKLQQHPKDTLMLCCKITDNINYFSTASVKMPGNTVWSKDYLHNLKTLANDLKISSVSLSNEKVVLQVGEETESVSKAILHARSPVFAKMFENNMRESKENVVIITDIKMHVLKVLVSFLYTGMLLKSDFDLASTDNTDFLFDLYYASNKYGVTELRQICSDLLLPRISMDNVIRIWKFAFSHNDEFLKSSALAFIAANIETWFSTNAWKNLIDDEPNIATELLNFVNF